MLASAIVKSPLSSSQNRRIAFALVSLLLGLSLSIVVLEICLRAINPESLDNPLRCLQGFYQLDAKNRIQTSTGWRGVQPVNGQKIEVRSNNLGMRGADVGPKQNASERRILMIGDSFVWGMGVAEQQAIPAQLEQRLRATSRNVLLGNAGMWGTSPREWGYTVDRFRQSFQPDAIVAVIYLGNDLSDLTLPPLYVLDGLPLTSEFAHVARSSLRYNMALRFRVWMALEHNLLNRVLPIAVPPKPQLLPDGVSALEGVFFDLGEARASATPLLNDFTADLHRHFADLQRAAHGLPTLVVVLPSHEVALKPYDQVVRACLPQLDPTWFHRGKGQCACGISAVKWALHAAISTASLRRLPTSPHCSSQKTGTIQTRAARKLLIGCCPS